MSPTIRYGTCATLLILFVAIASCTSQDRSSPSATTDTTPASQPLAGVLQPESHPPETTSRMTPVCTDADCFLTLARDCIDSDITLSQHGAIFSYSSKGCMLTKTLVQLSDTDPQALKTALEGKSMTCTYEKGLIDLRWVKTLMFGLEGCQGELKDALAWLLLVD